MIEESGDIYSSIEFNKAFCWVMKVNILREAPLMESFWGRVGGNGLSRSGNLEEENGNLKKNDCQ
jgi:hypothetical protein